MYYTSTTDTLRFCTLEVLPPACATLISTQMAVFRVNPVATALTVKGNRIPLLFCVAVTNPPLAVPVKAAPFAGAAPVPVLSPIIILLALFVLLQSPETIIKAFPVNTGVNATANPIITPVVLVEPVGSAGVAWVVALAVLTHVPAPVRYFVASPATCAGTRPFTPPAPASPPITLNIAVVCVTVRANGVAEPPVLLPMMLFAAKFAILARDTAPAAIVALPKTSYHNHTPIVDYRLMAYLISKNTHTLLTSYRHFRNGLSRLAPSVSGS